MVLVFCLPFSTSFRWDRNQAMTGSVLLTGIWFYLKSSVVEELIFRGFGFQQLIDRAGFVVAQLITATAFAVYHMLNIGMPPVQAILFTGSASLFFGYAFRRSRGAALPIGIHAAWNFWQEQLGGNSGRGQAGIWQPTPVTNEPASSLLFFGASLTVLLGAGAVIGKLYRSPAATVTLLPESPD
ncbi:MAG: CPBP family intramembrane metalloprotease [Acidobacteria bacterium]|nr:CPBP family intramembrane metalloprotease [Acidobacteriota bacterium]